MPSEPAAAAALPAVFTASAAGRLPEQRIALRNLQSFCFIPLLTLAHQQLQTGVAASALQQRKAARQASVPPAPMSGGSSSVAGRQGAVLLRAGYRAILRVHREKLPPPMQKLGDGYARQEFRAWGAASGVSQSQWQEFQSQWERYANMLLGVADSPAAASGDIPEDVLSRMNEEQRAQLASLREAVTS